eukprot:GFKZ01010080.1.p1 GENE.GFKZ01010080.1~~GFKZ01010080.1.p1  ORF type:complete len:673 (+),score=50.95 GFKZ01010080.1:309-2327(+)
MVTLPKGKQRLQRDDSQCLEVRNYKALGFRSSQWRPGSPCHWTEQSSFTKFKFLLIRFLWFLHFLTGIAYFRYRVADTIGVLSQDVAYVGYQRAFFFVEFASFVGTFLRIFEMWNSVSRNCIDFKKIPQDLFKPRFSVDSEGNPASKHSRFPTIDVLIPCYSEDVRLVQDTVSAALKIDYPCELLRVYLCDDGKDPSKRSMVESMRGKHKNLQYIVRPEHRHAKAGNLNYALRRTSGDLVITLDADFVARPNIVQRLLPYFFVWDPVIEMYKLDGSLAAVQAPQQYRNISPYDSDPTDQRATFFMEFVLPAKDWFNAAPIIGTTNLVSRSALEKVGLYPHYSVTEDTALSLNFHRSGYKTYYVTESLATGLATDSLWASFDQKERWLKGDWQIIFSRNGPLTTRGLNFVQRMLYVNMSVNRTLSILNMLFDVSCILLLTFGVQMVDILDTWKFLSVLIPYIITTTMLRVARVIGKKGLSKSDCGSLMFETMFRFVIVRGLISVLFNNRNIRFKVTDKSAGNKILKAERLVDKDWCKNLRRAWFNIVMVISLSASVWFGLSAPAFQTLIEGEWSSLPVVMAIGFTFSNLMPHLLCIYLCFKPVVSKWMMQDTVHGRCDQYAMDIYSGKLFVPGSYITHFVAFQVSVIFVTTGILAAFTDRQDYGYIALEPPPH